MVLPCSQDNLTAADAYDKVRAVTDTPLVLLVGHNENLAAELTDGAAHDVLVLRRPIRFPELVAALNTLITQANPQARSVRTCWRSVT